MDATLTRCMMDIGHNKSKIMINIHGGFQPRRDQDKRPEDSKGKYI